MWVGAVILLIYIFPGWWFAWIKLPDFSSYSSVNASQRLYIPKRQISNTIIWVTYANMTIGKWQSVFWINNTYDWDLETMLGLRKDLLDLIQRDFGQMMDSSTNREATLKWLIDKLEYYKSQSLNIQVSVVAKMQAREADYTNCLAKKTEADSLYLNTLNEDKDWGAKYIENLIIDAQTASTCMSDNRIQINAYALPLKQLQLTTNIAESYILVLNDNFANIVEHYSLLRSDILERLLITKQQLGL